MKAKSNTSSNKAVQRPIEGRNLILQMGKVEFALLKRGGMMSTCLRYINFLVAKMDFETCRNLVIVPIILKS